MNTSQATPRTRAACATARAWLPALAVTSPAAARSPSAATLASAPRSLNEPGPLQALGLQQRSREPASVLSSSQASVGVRTATPTSARGRRVEIGGRDQLRIGRLGEARSCTRSAADALAHGSYCEGIGCVPYRRNGGRGAMGELNDILQRLEPTLGPLSGTPGTAGRRHHEPQLPRHARRQRLRGPPAGQATPTCWGSTATPSGSPRETAAALGIAPEVAAALEGCLVTRFVRVRSRSSIAGGGGARARRSRGRCARFHESGLRCHVASGCPTCSRDYAAIVRARGGSAGSRCYDSGAARRRRSKRAAACSDARPCHNDLLAGNVIRARGERAA